MHVHTPPTYPHNMDMPIQKFVKLKTDRKIDLLIRIVID